MIEPQMINPYTYCFTTEVPYYQCDLSGKMKLSWLLKVMERAAGEHLEHIGLSYDRLYQEGIVFLLSKAAVRIHQCPTAADLLWVETAPQGLSLIHICDVTYEAGPDNQRPATLLSESLKKAGIPLRRFKTGTPARIKRSSIDFTNLEVQEGDEPIVPFSFETDPTGLVNREVCSLV